MSERRESELLEELDPVEHDPDRGSTWNTINDTEEIKNILSEQELEDFMSEPTEGELGILSDSDIPGRPG